MSERNPTLAREDKARLLVKYVVITCKGKSAMCPSFTDSSKMYHVNIEEGNCECPDNTHRGVNCMHMQAVDFKELDDKLAKAIERLPGAINSAIDTLKHNAIPEEDKKEITKAIKKFDTVCTEFNIDNVESNSEGHVENKVLAKIFDDVGIEDTQALIRKDLLLDQGTEQALKNWDQKLGKSEN